MLVIIAQKISTYNVIHFATLPTVFHISIVELYLEQHAEHLMINFE